MNKKSLQNSYCIIVVGIVLGFLIFLGSFNVASAAIAIDSTNSSKVNSGSTTLTFLLTTSGSNRILLVGVGVDKAPIHTIVSSITYNGVALTKAIATTSAQNIRDEIWYLVAPATGKHSIVITTNATATHGIAAGSVSLTGVNQTAPIPTTATNAGTTANPSTSITTAFATSLLFNALQYDTNLVIPTVGANQIRQYNQSTTSGFTNEGSTNATNGKTTYSMSWTAVADNWVNLITEIKPASVSNSKTLTETISDSDSITKNANKINSQTITDSDSITKMANKITSLSVSDSDGITKETGKSNSESVSDSDSITKSDSKTLTQTILDSDAMSKGANKNTSELILINDQLSHATSFSRSLDENSLTSDSLVKSIGKSLTELVSIADSLSVFLAHIITLTDTESNSDQLNAILHTIGAPTTLTATAHINSNSQIDLVWVTPVGNVTGYKIERSLDNISWLTIVNDTGNTNVVYADTGLTQNIQYYYRVSAHTIFVTGIPSNIASAWTNGVPAKVINLAAAAISNSDINLAWSTPSSNGSAILGYKIERSLNNSTWSTIVPNTGNTLTLYTDTGLSSSTLYYYRVSAINFFGTGLPSNVASATTLSGAGSGGGGGSGGAGGGLQNPPVYPNPLAPPAPTPPAVSLVVNPNSYKLNAGSSLQDGLNLSWSGNDQIQVSQVVAGQSPIQINFDQVPVTFTTSDKGLVGSVHYTLAVPNDYCQNSKYSFTNCVLPTIYKIPVTVTGTIGGQIVTQSTTISVDLTNYNSLIFLLLLFLLFIVILIFIIGLRRRRKKLVKTTKTKKGEVSKVIEEESYELGFDSFDKQIEKELKKIKKINK